ncbi:hypothetical protein, partial [Vulcaniibacterium tengchongense]
MTDPIRDSDEPISAADLLEAVLRHASAVGAVLVLLWPAARGASETFGWLPLWLLAMPLSACWALRRFRAPPVREAAPLRRERRRRGRAQA